MDANSVALFTSLSGSEGRKEVRLGVRLFGCSRVQPAATNAMPTLAPPPSGDHALTLMESRTTAPHFKIFVTSFCGIHTSFGQMPSARLRTPFLEAVILYIRSLYFKLSKS